MADTPAPKRCAIYTRKSTEEGLDQAFNSLDAQREACGAFILSQLHEGWTLVDELYEDGGYSGGSMARPGVTALLADVEAGRVDVIVVYKVDRLTRSLGDFAKMVDILDRAKASFVSVTQAFNTTTSMGRLTLNVLLSFAQFEREVTGERIRDKFAASKAKGMFMGGTAPLGYRAHDRGLHIVETEAELVRSIFKRYAALGSVRQLKELLDAEGHRTRVQLTKGGCSRGGVSFGTGTLYHMLSNRIYRGEVPHKGKWYPGNHEAIIDDALWSRAADTLASNRHERREPVPRTGRSLLAGRLFDPEGRPMTTCNAKKDGKIYRYYVTQPKLVCSTGPAAVRMSAPDLERAVMQQLVLLLRNGAELARVVGDRMAAAGLGALLHDAKSAAELLEGERPTAGMVAVWLQRACIGETHLTITIQLADDIVHTVECYLGKVRRGHDIKLVIADAAVEVGRDEALVALVAEAYALRKLAFAHPEDTIETLAERSGIWIVRFKRLLRLSYLAPDVVRTILEGRQPASLTVSKLNTLTKLPMCWHAQKALLGVG